MAEVAEGTPSLATPAPPHNASLTDPLIAGANLAAGRACTIRSTGLVHEATGAADDANAIIHGWTAKNYFAGQPVTLFDEVNFEYGSGLTPGAQLYLSATLTGRLNTVATTGGKQPCAFVVSPDKIHVMRTVGRQKIGP
jgi:hypothetical protein